MEHIHRRITVHAAPVFAAKALGLAMPAWLDCTFVEYQACCTWQVDVDLGRLCSVHLACPRSIKCWVLPRFYLLGHVSDVGSQTLSYRSACNIERSVVGLGTRLYNRHFTLRL